MAEDSESSGPVFEISDGILQSSEFSQDKIHETLQILSEVMGDNLQSITDFEISSLNGLRELHYLAESISFFAENETLDQIINRFESSQEAHSHIPTLFFARYIFGESGEIEFEPDRGDILLNWQGETITFEFKRPRMNEEVKRHMSQHLDALDAIKSILDDDFQYDIRYDTEGDLEVLLPLLDAAVANLNSPGRTRLANTIEVTLQETNGFNEDAPVGGIILYGSMKDLDSGDLMPQTTYGGREATFSIAGPKIDETEKLAEVIEGARKQLTRDTPNVVVVHIGGMMDSLSNLKRETQNVFKSSSNTRLNAVVLWEYHYTNGGEIEVTSRTVRNPYAAKELPNEFFDLLPNLDEEVVTC